VSGLKKRDNSRSVVAWPVVRSKGSTSACNFAGNLQRIKQETTGAAVACKGLAEGCFIVVGNSPDQTRAKLDDELQRQGDGPCRVGHEAWLGLDECQSLLLTSREIASLSIGLHTSHNFSSHIP